MSHRNLSKISKARNLNIQGYPDHFILEATGLSPSTYYRHKASWAGQSLVVGVYDFLNQPRARYFSEEHQGHPFLYDVHLIQQLAVQLNRPIKFIFKRFDKLLESLGKAECDLAVGLLANTGSRRQAVHFTDSYVQKRMRDGALLVPASSGIRGNLRASWQSQRFAVVRGSRHEEFLREGKNPDLVVRAYDSMETCFVALRQNWVDAILGPESVLGKKCVQENGRLRLEITDLKTETCIAVSKENGNLVEILNKALADLRGQNKIELLSQRFQI